MALAAPTDPYELFTFHMVRAHFTFKAGYDSILKHLDNPPTDDLGNFLGYCQSWAGAIDQHHGHEEHLLFPFLNQKLDFSNEVEQHKLIHGALDAVIDSIRAAEADPATFDAAKLKSLMETLREPLFAHLDEEVEHIAPANTKVFEAQDLMDLMNTLETHAKASANKLTTVPFVCSHTPPEWKDAWPGFPWVLRKFVIPYIFAMWYSGYWKYSPYSMS